MSKLKELIQQYCPDGVIYKRLGDVASVTAGNSAPQGQDLFENGQYPFCRTADVGRVKKSVEFCDITDRLNEKGIKGLRLFPKGSILIPKSGASTLLNNKVRLSIDSYVVSHLAVVIPNETIIDSRFLYYAIEGFDMGTLVEDKSYPSVKASKIADGVEVPLPALPVQREIVRILDEFSLLSAELAAELAARKQQYEYYRDHLIHDFGYRRVRIEEIEIDIFRGSGIKRDQVTEDGVPCVRYGEIYTTYNTWFDKCVSHTKTEYIQNPKWIEKGDIIFAITGESVEDIAKSCAYVGDDKCLAGGDTVVLKHKQNPKYLAYALETKDAIVQKGKGKIKSKVVHSNVPSIETIEIPLPSIEKQNEIADTLDSFHNLILDFEIGIPAEIKTRQNQYEYYRDKLFTFKRKEV